MNKVEDVIELGENTMPIDYYLPEGYTRGGLEKLL